MVFVSNTIQYNTIQYNTIQYNTINTIQYNTIQCNTIQYNTIQYNTIHNFALRKVPEKGVLLDFPFQNKVVNLRHRWQIPV